MTQLRAQGIAHLRDVRHACMESDGNIRVIRYGKSQDTRHQARRTATQDGE
jgi:uncharacterized membrane protein YcaP (DUF421 family)